MIVVEYQFTKRELLFIGIWYDLKYPLSIIMLLLFLIAEILFLISGGNFLNWATFGTIFGLLLRIGVVYRQVTSNPINVLRTRLSVGETGILITTAETRLERTWHSLHSWSQSKNYFYLYAEKKGGLYILIPKRAFTDEQMEEFIRHLKKIYTHQLPQMLHQEKSPMEQKDKIIGKLFLSYAREDIDTALRLFNDLSKAGIDVWLDREYLLPGQNWKATIRQAIRGSRFFLALLSNNSISKKGYVQNELKHALEILDEYPESKIFIIPIRIENCNPTSEKLKELHWIDIFDNWEQGLALIFKTIQSQSNT